MDIILKIAGGAAICVASALIGVYYSKNGQYRLNDLTDLKRALILLKSEIDFAQNALPDALSNVGARTGGEIGGAFIKIAERVSERRGELHLIWEDEISSGFKRTYLTKSDVDAVLQLGKIIGYMDKPLQAGNIDMAVSYIDQTSAALREKREKTSRLYTSLGILGGLLITIIIL